MKREMYLFLHPPVLVFFILLTSSAQRIWPNYFAWSDTVGRVVSKFRTFKQFIYLCADIFCDIIAMDLLFFFLGEGTGVDHKIHIVSFPSRPFDIFDDSWQNSLRIFIPQLPQVVLRLFCNLLHFPGFPSAPPRAVFACPVEAWPSLHLNRHCLDRPKCIIYISMSRLHKLNSSLGNPAQKVTASTSQLRLSSRVFSWPV